jgi:hypothetical protein
MTGSPFGSFGNAGDDDLFGFDPWQRLMYACISSQCHVCSLHACMHARTHYYLHLHKSY